MRGKDVKTRTPSVKVCSMNTCSGVYDSVSDSEHVFIRDRVENPLGSDCVHQPSESNPNVLEYGT